MSCAFFYILPYFPRLLFIILQRSSFFFFLFFFYHFSFYIRFLPLFTIILHLFSIIFSYTFSCSFFVLYSSFSFMSSSSSCHAVIDYIILNVAYVFRNFTRHHDISFFFFLFLFLFWFFPLNMVVCHSEYLLSHWVEESPPRAETCQLFCSWANATWWHWNYTTTLRLAVLSLLGHYIRHWFVHY